MGRTAATVWHTSLSVIAAILYFLFVIPRWWELTGFTPHVLGTVLRVIVGAMVGLSALPVVFTLRRTGKPEFGTPQLALTLLVGSIVAHVVAGALIAGTALSEIWLSLDSAGPWLFGIYGAAAAIALLGIGAFQLSFIAESPPPPPKPLKPKKDKQSKRRRRDKDADEAPADETADEAEDDADEDEAEDVEADEDSDDETGAVETDDDAAQFAETEPTGEDHPELAPTASSDKPRPSGKRRAKSGE